MAHVPLSRPKMPPAERNIVGQSLAEFNEACNFYLGQNNFPGFISHALCGQGDSLDRGRYQVTIDPILNRLDEDHPISILRDYDSLIGVSPHIRVKGALRIYAIAKHEDALQNNIHLSHPIVSFHVYLYSSQPLTLCFRTAK